MAVAKETAQKDLTAYPMSDKQKKREELAKKYQYLREKAKQKVRGKFIYHEVPGGVFEFCFGPIYKGDETEKYTLTDGGVYELPLGVAQHLNKNVAYPEYGYIPAQGGDQALQGGYAPNQGMKVKAMVRRVSFQSLEFLDIEDMPSNIVKVETIL